MAKSNPWPGTPTSQQSPPINAPSVRNFPSLNEHSTMGDVAHAVKVAFDGLTNHEQAFANLPAQIASQASAAATAAVENIESQTTTGVTAFNTQTGAVVYFPNLGRVNDQLGNTIYLTQTSDAGQKIVMGDSTPATVTLNPAMAPPWFAFIGNDSGATVAISTDSGATINGLQSIYPGGTAIVFYDGSTFWCEGAAIATDSSLGVVKPDGTTITVDSTGTLRAVGGGATFVYDSSVGGGPTSWNLPQTPIAGEVVLYSGSARLHYGVDWTGSAWLGTGQGITTNYPVTPGTLYADYQYLGSGSAYSFVYDSSVGGGPTSWNLSFTPVAGRVVLYSGSARLHYGSLPNGDWTGAAWLGTGTGITTNYPITPGTLFVDYQHS